MKFKFCFAGIFLFIFFQAHSQNEVDALRYSNLTFGGTARFTSMGGAFSALGGDISCLSFNPAGIAIYRKNELTFSPSFVNQTASSTYLGNTTFNDKFNFNISNFGLIVTHLKEVKENEEGWVNFNFGIGYNRTNNFHNRIFIVGNNSENNLLETFTNDAKGIAPSALSEFSTLLAYNTYLIDDTIPGTTYDYFSRIPPGTLVRQSKSIQTEGSMSETVFTYGGNYRNKFYVGGSLGIPRLKYFEESTYEENDINDSIKGFKSYTFENNLSAKGSGLNFKLGAIYRISDLIRVSGAIHTPTFFSINEKYTSKIIAFYNDSTLDPESPIGEFHYNLTTPMRLLTGIAFIFEKKGLLSADYEFVNYTKARLSSYPDVFAESNAATRAKYKGASIIRLGGEYRLDPFSLRLGYAFYGSPYSNNINDGKKSYYTAGIGVRGQAFYFDLSYILGKSKEDYYLYPSPTIKPVNNEFKGSNLSATLGLKF